MRSALELRTHPRLNAELHRLLERDGEPLDYTGDANAALEVAAYLGFLTLNDLPVGSEPARWQACLPRAMAYGDTPTEAIVLAAIVSLQCS